MLIDLLVEDGHEEQLSLKLSENGDSQRVRNKRKHSKFRREQVL